MKRPHETLNEVYYKYASKPTPVRTWTIFSNSVVVVQEFSLTCYLMARHRASLFQQDGQDLPAAADLFWDSLPVNLEDRIFISNVFISLALALAIVYGNLSDPARQQKRTTKARQRMADSVLLGILLRFLSGLVRTLTASYSSDTVQSLTLGGMTLHVLTCNYSFANGMTEVISVGDKRPPFGGGTVALNAAFFATTLMVSRLHSNSQAYFFLSAAVVLFAFFSLTRNAIASTFPPSSNPALWLISGLVILSTCSLILDDVELLRWFLGGCFALGIVLPTWKRNLHSQKTLIRGPWDIPKLKR